jgi:hypothetical protein
LSQLFCIFQDSRLRLFKIRLGCLRLSSANVSDFELLVRYLHVMLIFSVRRLLLLLCGLATTVQASFSNSQYLRWTSSKWTTTHGKFSFLSADDASITSCS